MTGALLFVASMITQESYWVQLYQKTKLAFLPFLGFTLGVWACLREDKSLCGFINVWCKPFFFLPMRSSNESTQNMMDLMLLKVYLRCVVLFIFIRFRENVRAGKTVEEKALCSFLCSTGFYDTNLKGKNNESSIHDNMRK